MLVSNPQALPPQVLTEVPSRHWDGHFEQTPGRFLMQSLSARSPWTGARPVLQVIAGPGAFPVKTKPLGQPLGIVIPQASRHLDCHLWLHLRGAHGL